MADLVVAQQHTERFAASPAELLFVDLAEQLALVEFDGPLGIPRQLVPPHAQHADLDVLGFSFLLDQVPQSAPRRLQPLKTRMVKDRVQLLVQQAVQLGDVAIQQAGQLILVGNNGGAACPVQPHPQGGGWRRFLQKVVQHARRLRLRRASRLDDPVENAGAGFWRNRPRRAVRPRGVRRSLRLPVQDCIHAGSGTRPYLVNCGMRATSRMDVVNSSSCSQGLSQQTAL